MNKLNSGMEQKDSKMVKYPMEIHGAKCVAHIPIDALDDKDEYEIPPENIYFQDINLSAWKCAVESLQNCKVSFTKPTVF